MQIPLPISAWPPMQFSFTEPGSYPSSGRPDNSVSGATRSLKWLPFAGSVYSISVLANQDNSPLRLCIFSAVRTVLL
jgi:hypothetical protein